VGFQRLGQWVYLAATLDAVEVTVTSASCFGLTEESLDQIALDWKAHRWLSHHRLKNGR
jgi:hypothetical protein